MCLARAHNAFTTELRGCGQDASLYLGTCAGRGARRHTVSNCRTPERVRSLCRYAYGHGYGDSHGHGYAIRDADAYAQPLISDCGGAD